MNLILFESHEVGRPLPFADPRAQHLREVLRRAPGEGFDCGLVDGPRGRGAIRCADAAGLHLDFAWGDAPPPLDPIGLIAGMPRPQTVRRILTEAAALGVARLTFFPSEKGEPSYAQSTVWRPAEVRRLLLTGAAQAFCTRLPQVARTESLSAALAGETGAGSRLALDNYEATTALSAIDSMAAPVLLALGSERGWSPAERDQLRTHGFTLAHLGPRVQRMETAAIMAITLVKARLGRC